MSTCDWNRINLSLFVDRELLASRITSGLQSSESFCVLGGRKAGKTMLLKRVEADCPMPFVPAYLNFQTAPHGFDLRWVAEELARICGVSASGEVDFVRSIEALVQALRHKGRSLVIILDEVESLDGCDCLGANQI